MGKHEGKRGKREGGRRGGGRRKGAQFSDPNETGKNFIIKL